MSLMMEPSLSVFITCWILVCAFAPLRGSGRFALLHELDDLQRLLALGGILRAAERGIGEIQHPVIKGWPCSFAGGIPSVSLGLIFSLHAAGLL